jgi:hypothetical protein
MWMTTRDRGLAATLYGPCVVTAQAGDNVPVRLECSTAYPFEEEVRIRIDPEKSATFPLLLRVPAWCGSPSLSVCGESQPVRHNDEGFVRLERTWVKGDTIVLRLPMATRLDRGRETPYPRSDYFAKQKREAYAHETMDNPFMTVSYGPLLFALPIADLDPETVAPGARWNYALDVKDPGAVVVERRPMPGRWSWQLDAPLVLRVPVRSFDWKPTSAQPLPSQPVEGGQSAAVALVPYGCTKFRVSMFPVTASAWGRR